MVSHQELALGWRAQLSAINNIADVHKFVTAESDKLDCRTKAGSEASIYLQAEFSRRKRQLGQVPSAKENNQPAGANADMGRMAPGKRPLADGDQLREACAGRNADPFQVRNAVHNRERGGSGAVERDVAVRPRAAPPSAVAVDIVVLSDDEEGDVEVEANVLGNPMINIGPQARGQIARPMLPYNSPFVRRVAKEAVAIAVAEQIKFNDDVKLASMLGSRVIVDAVRQAAIPRRMQAAKLLDEMSDEALFQFVGVDDGTSIQEKAESAIMAVASFGKEGHLSGMRNSLVLLRQTFDELYRGQPRPPHDAFGVDVVLSLLQRVHHSSAARASQKGSEIRSMLVHSALGEEQVNRRVNNGSTAAGTRLSRLSSLALKNVAKLDLSSPAIQVFRLKRSLPTKVRVPTVRDVVLLEAAAAVHENEVVRGYAAAELLCCFGSMRGCQSRNQDWIASKQMSGEKVLFSIGHIKHPQGIAKQKTYVQITPADGIIHSDKVMAAFNHMQAGAEKMGCTFRGCDSEDGDPFKATRFTNVPCTDDQLRVAKRALYRVICKYPASVADAFGVNSARHWMVEIMLSRGTPVEHLVQAGLWSDHAMKGVHPQARSVGDRQKLLSTLPLEYAHNARVLYVVDVKLVEMQAVREYVKRIDAKALPTDEAWSHFRRNVQRHPLAPPLPAIPLPAERQRMEDDRMRELLQAAIWEEGGEGVSG